MADDLGIDRRTVIRSMQRLLASGFVVSRRESRDDGSRAANSYRVVAPIDQGELFGDEGVVAPESPGVVTAVTPGVVAPTSHQGSDSTASPHRTTPSERRTTTTTPRATVDAPNHRRPARRPDRPPGPELLLPIPGGAEATAVDAPPERPPDSRPTPVPERMAEQLVAAAGIALSQARFADTTLLSMSVPLGWMRNGADFELDVLPTVQRLGRRKSPGKVRSWDYFTEAIFEARDRRLAPAPAGRDPPIRGTADAAPRESPTRAALRRVRNG